MRVRPGSGEPYEGGEELAEREEQRKGETLIKREAAKKGDRKM